MSYKNSMCRSLVAVVIAVSMFGSAGAMAYSYDSVKPDVVKSADGRLVRDRTLDLSGFYFPKSDVQSGNFKLDHIHMGSDKEFVSFEAKGQTIKTYSPFMLSFDDMSSKEIIGESGPYRERSTRVFCKTYAITRESMSCEGYDALVGKVSFKGRFDLKVLAVLNDPEAGSNALGEAAVITGDLTVGGKTFNNIGLRYWAGD